MTQVEIALDRSSAIFTAGEVIKGRVELKVSQELRVRGIRLLFYGLARVSWDEKRVYVKGSSPSVAHKNTEVYLDHVVWLLRRDLVRSRSNDRRRQSEVTGRHLEVKPKSEQRRSSLCFPAILMGDGEEDILIQPGYHKYPFTFDLPKCVPGSFEGKWGSIKYCMKVTVDRPYRVDDEFAKPFTVNPVVDLNEDPECVRPVGTGSDFMVGLLCCQSGPVMAELRVARKGFAPGEAIPVYAEVDNGSRRKMFLTKLALVQLTIQPNGWDEAFSVPIYVDIGTIPIKKSCVKRYLKQLGQSAGLELTATNSDLPTGNTPLFPRHGSLPTSPIRKCSDTTGLSLEVPKLTKVGRRYSSGSYDNVRNGRELQDIPEDKT